MLVQTHLNREYWQDRYDYWMRGKQEDGNLFNERNFYRAFIKDMLEAKKEVVIYSPFVSKYRTDYLKRTIEKLKEKNIEVFVFTRPVKDYDLMFQSQIRCALKRYEELGVCIFFLKGFIHEKVAVIDREILWEGSLNILSQKASREMMRRIEGENPARQVISYLGLNKKLEEGYKLKYERLCRNLMINSEQNRRLKIRIFLLGLAIPIVVWLLIGLGDIILSLQSPEFVANVIRLLTSNRGTL
jgi:phosphatidylserine/phosphatidylglycerophosphate/cardiolipin synthase-like enzyme